MQWCRFVSLLSVLLIISDAAVAKSSAEANPPSVKFNVSTPLKLSAPATSEKSSYTPSYVHSSNNMWAVIASNFSLPHYADTPAVQRQIQWFQTHQKYFNKVASQGQPYMFYIYEEVKKRGLPGELVLLPMIESAYDPFAYSWVGAAGLWQMMPATGANFGLKQDWWYDGRKDIISSTSAALDYLTYLDTFFNGNWPLAIAAYNSGEGTVQNAIDRNAHRGRGTTFWALNLPAETESYVPRLLALAAIISNPAKYGVDLPPVHNGPYFGVVSLKQQIDLSQAAKLAEIPLSELYELNPGYNRWATDPKGPYRLLLPISAISRFEAKYSMQFGSHNIVSANSPSNATTKAVLASTTESNPNTNGVEQSMVKGKTPTPTTHSLNVGQESHASAPKSTSTTAPAKTTTTPAATPIVTTKENPPPVKTSIKYTVKPGDTLWSIAKHFNVTIGQLRTWNKLSEKARVNVGQTLIIEQQQQPESSNKYIVKPGDTLYSIARAHGLHITDIEALNPQLLKNSELEAGTVIYLS
jgi:membrane-bound lytic murein transglycosylase D